MLTQKLKNLFTTVSGFPAGEGVWPSIVAARPRLLATSDTSLSSTLLVTGWPGEVDMAWLDHLTGDGVEASIHIVPVNPIVAASRLRKRRARLEAARRYEANRDKLDDPSVEAAAQAAADLAGRIARGETRLHTVAVYLTVHATTATELTEKVAAVSAHAAAGMWEVRPVTWRQVAGRVSTLPVGVDLVGARRATDTDVAAAAFPFVSPDAPATHRGVLYGLNLYGGGPVWWDRWARDNHNSVVIARSGAGKSYFTKTEVIRQLIDEVEVSIIDPDGEYLALAEHLGGTVTTPGATHLNPLALPVDADDDALTRRVMFTGTLVAALLETDVSPAETAALDHATIAAYQEHGINLDRQTWHHEPPTMVDVHRHLTESGEEGRVLAAQLAPYVHGGLSGLFTGDATTAPGGHLTVYNLRHLPDELQAAGTLLVLDAIWRSLRDDGVRRLIVVDEAWLLLRQPAAAAYLSRLAKTVRKRHAGLMLVTQDAIDMLASDLGHTVIANAATQILLRQAPQALDQVVDAFNLTGAERHLVATAQRGEALLLSGETHVAFRSVASENEHDWCVTGLNTNLGGWA
ncbi:hypothetical protein FB566_0865 [Stackebrandtia endophytica]|uniref:TraG P-loop domain-containing protein n=1 Tax=Stackebrandtia endophytica TaxID=1496996 RepID=A0A543AS81_9ACTN|nr:hypothetical protein [Stackebrandtia endophytica]TQL75365.1 hypothetical protein FB566_0865 [Stackebrandtia endophytica]